ncbi:CBASS cGAMP-activated phospholipase [Bacillus sp. T33-2]|uniref:CBASS cGAMP-activated phospholipase n=1 Tax=Bacillus sp. T33-2 TaxID=2054168 RepID=UPI000C7866DB|nr:CBASS cGAMP-activated phospholipase [Bacillus sp. T33-2]PLR91156.1 patatin [Bacillus sp. T33-2]
MKMLCIDGGGIRGVFAIAILQAIEGEYKQPVGNLFDVIAGTSTGAIIAASAALNINMADVMLSYKAYGKKIFKRQATFGLFKSVYSDGALRRLLKNVFGDRRLADINKPLLIPAVDITHGKPYVHRSNYGHPGDLTIHLWDAVLSSCSAPIYFPPNILKNQCLTIDGGLWANNPSLVCITEAVHQFKAALGDTKILSIGTGKQNIDFSKYSEKRWGLTEWLPISLPSLKPVPKLLDLALDLSSEAVSYHCQLLLQDNYLRINEELQEEVPFDKVENIDSLIEFGANVFKERKNEIGRFLEG